MQMGLACRRPGPGERVPPGRSPGPAVPSPRDGHPILPLATRRSIVVDHASTESGPGPVAGPGPGVDGGPKPSIRLEGPSPAYVTPRWAWAVFGLVFAMHVLDSAQRWLLTAVLPRLGEELGLSEAQAGWLSTVMLLGFAAAGPPIGYLADRMRRPRLLAIGFALASLATVGTGLAGTYDQLQVARALVGVGGAAFLATALTILMDVFPRELRGRVLAGFFLAMPVGAALGLGLGA